MIKIGVIGLGKLGTPVATALASKFSVMGYDVNRDLCKLRPYEHREKGPTLEEDFQDYFTKAVEEGRLSFADSLQEAVAFADILFLAIQTPHQPEFDGSVRLPTYRADFDYSYLQRAAHGIAKFVRPEQTVAVISTVLPGTMRERILPILGGRCKFVYNPFFIAMGSVVHNFLNPEFVLLGGDQTKEIKEFYVSFYGGSKPPILCMSIESAELTKVAYNTYISSKIGIANLLMEISHKIPGCNVDDVTNALQKATDRIVSPAYMKGSVGDGGHCHIRDNVSMSWLAGKLGLSFDFFGGLMIGREKQAEFLAQLILREHSKRPTLPVVLLGKAFKPETNIIAGSSAILLANILKGWGLKFEHYDHYVDGLKWVAEKSPPDPPKIYFLATQHEIYRHTTFPIGSVVLDPFRMIEKQEGVEVIPIGIGREV